MINTDDGVWVMISLLVGQIFLTLRTTIISYFNHRRFAKRLGSDARFLSDPTLISDTRAASLVTCSGLVKFSMDSTHEKRIVLFKLPNLESIDQITQCFHAYGQKLVVTSVIYDNVIVGERIYLIIYYGHFVTSKLNNLILFAV